MARVMKDSGILWIGKIPDEWEVVPHKYVMHKEKEICEKYNDEDIISLTMNGVIVRDLVNPTGKMPATFDGYQRVYAGNLLMCLFDIDVTPRCVGYIRNDGLTSPAYSQFVVDNGNYPQFYDYLLRMIDDGKHFLHLSKNLRSSLTEENFGAIKTIVPPMHEQKKIADFLDVKVIEIDSIIKQTKESIKDYKKYRQAVISEAVRMGLDNAVSMKESGIKGIGVVNEKYSVLRLKYLFGYGDDGLKVGPFGSAMKGKTLENGEYKIYNQAHLISGDFSFDRHYISEDSFNELKSYEVKSGDVLFSMMGTIGKCRIMPEGFPKGIMDSHLLKARLNNKVLPKYFEYVYDKDNSDIIIAQMLEMANGSIMTGLNSTIVKNLFMPVPSLSEQEEIVEYLDVKCAEIDELIAKKEAFVEEMEVYKKSLIYEYVTGKKEV